MLIFFKICRLTLERPTGLVGRLQEMISLYLKNYDGYYAEIS